MYNVQIIENGKCFMIFGASSRSEANAKARRYRAKGYEVKVVAA